MLLSDNQILREIERGNIIIEPFRPKQMGANSYDVRLGQNFWFGDSGKLTHYDPWDEETVKLYWNLRVAHKRVIIHPGETVLAHTVEFAGGKNGIVSYLRARSSLVRSGIDVCKSAGMGDSGYVNRWTMELNNFSNLPIVLYLGQRIAQLLFFKTAPPEKEYDGKYNIDDFEKWTPDMMIPQLWKDWDAPIKITRQESAPVMRRLISGNGF